MRQQGWKISPNRLRCVAIKNGEALHHTGCGWRDLMAGLTHNLTNSVANVRRKLLEMMDALAESGLRHAHREISRGREIAPKKRKMRRKNKPADSAIH